MKLIGLTGGIGMGKSTSADLLSRRGIPVVDTDVLAREMVEPGQPALADVVAAFGNEVLAGDGTLQRGVLARKVFSNETLRKQLEGILHPRIRERWRSQVERWKEEGRRGGVVVIPLLFETGAESLFEAVVCTACSPSSQRERLLKRGWSEQESERRKQAQWPVEKKMSHSRFVVWTEGSLEVHAAQWQRILTFLDLP
ncbi:MAG: dephospho-CoA kinase [Verrucomicrobiales bacterium]|nr:dephospho-CoA kinase [Verrucomicrobiales bacterium]